MSRDTVSDVRTADLPSAKHTHVRGGGGGGIDRGGDAMSSSSGSSAASGGGGGANNSNASGGGGGGSAASGTFVDRIDPFAKRSMKKKQKRSQGSSRYRGGQEVELQALPLLKGKEQCFLLQLLSTQDIYLS